MTKNRKFKTKLGHRLYKTQRDIGYAVSDTAKKLWACKLQIGMISLTGAMIYAAIKAPEWKEEISFKQAENRMRRDNWYESQIEAGKFTPEQAEAISKQIEKDREDYLIRVKIRAEKEKLK